MPYVSRSCPRYVSEVESIKLIENDAIIALDDVAIGPFNSREFTFLIGANSKLMLISSESTQFLLPRGEGLFVLYMY